MEVEAKEYVDALKMEVSSTSSRGRLCVMLTDRGGAVVVRWWWFRPRLCVRSWFGWSWRRGSCSPG